MSAINSPFFATFGLYPLKKVAFSSDYRKPITIGNIIGWIPVIGAVIGAIRIKAGISRMAEMSRLSGEEKAFCQGLIARGIAEILCLGPLLLVTDLFFTAAREMGYVPNFFRPPL